MEGGGKYPPRRCQYYILLRTLRTLRTIHNIPTIIIIKYCRFGKTKVSWAGIRHLTVGGTTLNKLKMQYDNFFFRLVLNYMYMYE